MCASALPLLLLPLLIAATARAAPVNYTLSTGTSAQFSDGTADFVGSFTFDPVTVAEITVSGLSPWNGLYNSPIAVAGSNVIAAADPSSGFELELSFVNPLGSVEDPLSFATFSTFGVVDQSRSASGFAIPAPTPATEPSSSSLLGTLLFFWGLSRRRSVITPRFRSPAFARVIRLLERAATSLTPAATG